MVQWHVTERLLAEAARRPGATVVDEGFLQCLWSACLADETEPWLQLYGLKRRPVPDVLVALRVTPVVAAKRLANRSSRHSRVQRMPGDALMRELLRGDALVEELLRWWRKTGDLPRAVIEVSADGSARDVAATVMQCLHRSASCSERGG
jgi:thymidylate kinase